MRLGRGRSRARRIQQSEAADCTCGRREAGGSLPASTSLPLLRQAGPRSPDLNAKPLPVARGAARVAARKGVSVGASRPELKDYKAFVTTHLAAQGS